MPPKNAMIEMKMKHNEERKTKNKESKERETRQNSE